MVSLSNHRPLNQASFDKLRVSGFSGFAIVLLAISGLIGRGLGLCYHLSIQDYREMAMEIGVFLPLSAEAMDVAELAQRAEAAGFESMWMPEHPIMPAHTTSQYRGTPDGSVPPYMYNMVDPYMALSRASAVTSTIKLGTSISLIPERNPLMLAKVIATLDHYSGGRFILGVGAGWHREETTIMGGDFDHRWGQTRENILAMKELWTQEQAEFHGRFVDFPPVYCDPKPAQKPHPPVLLGGAATNLFRRIVGWADGWIPSNPTPEQIRAGRATLEELAESAGRDPGSIQVTAFAVAAERETLAEFAEAGADRAIVMLPDARGAGAGEDLERIAGAVL